jgi:glycosyltransferase involved in cell wall biosynthesis
MGGSAGLSIAIPTYDRRASVVCLVEAIKCQLLPEDELIVVDDGSSDGTAAALEAVPQVKLVRHTKNQGMVRTWNNCLEAATREWICLIHDDDSLGAHALEAIRRACSIINEPGLIEHAPNGSEDTPFRCRVLEPGARAVLHSALIPSGATVHRSVIDTVGMFDERFTYSTDIEYFARICTRYKSVVIESPDVIKYNFHQSNYQYRTWRQPDFFAQLEEILKLKVGYARLPDQEAQQYFRDTMTNYVLYVLRTSARNRDRIALRKAGSVLLQIPGIDYRWRIKARVASVLGWCPRLG